MVQRRVCVGEPLLCLLHEVEFSSLRQLCNQHTVASLVGYLLAWVTIAEPWRHDSALVSMMRQSMVACERKTGL